MNLRTILAISLVVVMATVALAQSPRKSSPTPTSGLGQFSWIVGTWEVTGNFKKAAERWTRDSIGAYSGTGMTIKGNDTTITQRSTITKEGTKIVFSTEFVLRKQHSKYIFDHSDTSGYYFESPDPKEYPMTINYQPIGSDSLASWVGGPSAGGVTQRQGFKYRRSR